MKLKLTFLGVVVMQLLHAQIIDEKILEGFRIRSVGPAGMSGRITAIDVVNREPDHIYVGSASGEITVHVLPQSVERCTNWLP